MTENCQLSLPESSSAVMIIVKNIKLIAILMLSIFYLVKNKNF